MSPIMRLFCFPDLLKTLRTIQHEKTAENKAFAGISRERIHCIIRFVSEYDTQNQKTCCLSLAWEIDFEEAPTHIALSDNRLLVSSRRKMRSYHVGKKTRLVWSKPFRHNNDFQAHIGNKLYSFDSTGFLTVHDFWTGGCLMDADAPKDILGAHSFDDGLAIVSKESAAVFDTRMYQWTDSKKGKISKPFFGGSEALLLHDCGTASVVSLRNLAKCNVSSQHECKILDARYFDGRFACLCDNGKVTFVGFMGQEDSSFSFYPDFLKILHFDENVLCVSDDYRTRGYSIADGSLLWSIDCARITAHGQSKGVLCIGMSDGVAIFVDSPNGAIMAAFEGTSQMVMAICHKDLWMLGFEDGNVFALTMDV